MVLLATLLALWLPLVGHAADVESEGPLGWNGYNSDVYIEGMTRGIAFPGAPYGKDHDGGVGMYLLEAGSARALDARTIEENFPLIFDAGAPDPTSNYCVVEVSYSEDDFKQAMGSGRYPDLALPASLIKFDGSGNRTGRRPEITSGIFRFDARWNSSYFGRKLKRPDGSGSGSRLTLLTCYGPDLRNRHVTEALSLTSHAPRTER